MRSVRCDRCGFVQAERATCRKCGYTLALAGAGREPAFGWSEEHEQAVASGAGIEEPRLGFDEAEEARVAVGGGRRAARARAESVIAVPVPAEPEWPVDAAGPVAVVEDATAASDVPQAKPMPTPESRGEPTSKKAAPETITRIRSVPLTASLDATGHVMIEFQCRKCDRYGVLLVPPELMEKGIEGECGSCHRSAPMTRVELEAKRFDRYEG